MSIHVILSLSNEFRRRDKMRGLPSMLSFFAMSLINSIIQVHKYYEFVTFPLVSWVMCGT